MKRSPKLTKRERKARAPARPPRVQCGSVNVNFDPALQCMKDHGHHPPRHCAKAPKGTLYQSTDVGGKTWYWAEYQGMDGYRKGEMLDPQLTPATEDESEVP